MPHKYPTLYLYRSCAHHKLADLGGLGRSQLLSICSQIAFSSVQAAVTKFHWLEVDVTRCSSYWSSYVEFQI